MDMFLYFVSFHRGTIDGLIKRIINTVFAIALTPVQEVQQLAMKLHSWMFKCVCVCSPVAGLAALFFSLTTHSPRVSTSLCDSIISYLGMLPVILEENLKR